MRKYFFLALLFILSAIEARASRSSRYSAPSRYTAPSSSRTTTTTSRSVSSGYRSSGYGYSGRSYYGGPSVFVFGGTYYTTYNGVRTSHSSGGNLVPVLFCCLCCCVICAFACCGNCKGMNVGGDDHFDRYSGSDHHSGYNEYSVVETTTVTHDDGYPSQAPPGYY